MIFHLLTAFQISTRPLTLHVVYYSKLRPESQRMAEKIPSKLCFRSVTPDLSVTGQGLDTGQERGGVAKKRQKPLFFSFYYFFFAANQWAKKLNRVFLALAVSFLVFLLFL